MGAASRSTCVTAKQAVALSANYQHLPARWQVAAPVTSACDGDVVASSTNWRVESIISHSPAPTQTNGTQIRRGRLFYMTFTSVELSNIDPCSQPGIFRSIPRFTMCATRWFSNAAREVEPTGRGDDLLDVYHS